MSIIMPNELKELAEVYSNAQEKYCVNGVEIEKGAIITKRRIERNFDTYKDYMEFFMNYPDLFLDTIKPTTSKFQLKFFQRIFLRACTRYGRVLTIAPRAAGKSFICIIALYLICIFRPKSHVFICAPGKGQGAKIANQKLHQLWELFPLLKAECDKANFGNDYVELVFANGSQFDIMSPLNSTRGQRATFGILDEFRQN